MIVGSIISVMLKTLKTLRSLYDRLTPKKFTNIDLLLRGNKQLEDINLTNNLNLFDSSLNNFQLSRVNNPCQDSFSPFSNNFSVLYNGSSWTVFPSHVAFDFGTLSYTVEGWFNFSSTTSSFQRVWFFSNDNDNLELTGSILKLSGSGMSNAIVTPNGTIKPHTWYHIAISRDGSITRMFINGVSQGSTTTIVGTTVRAFSLMAHSNGANATSGYVYNFRITKGTGLYINNFIPPTGLLPAVTGTSLLFCSSRFFKDLSTTNITFTQSGSPQIVNYGPYSEQSYDIQSASGSLRFPTSSDYFETSPHEDFNFRLENFTIEWFQYLTSAFNASGGFSIGQKQGDATNGWQIYRNSSDTVYSIRLTLAVDYKATVTPVPFQWEHWAVVRNGTTLTWYRNGEAVGVYTGVSRNTFETMDVNNTSKFRIGQAQTWGSAFNNGYVSNIRITRSAVYTSNFTTPTSKLQVLPNTVFLYNGTHLGLVEQSQRTTFSNLGSSLNFGFPNFSSYVKKFNPYSIEITPNNNYVLDPHGHLYMGNGNFTLEFQIYIDNFSTAMVIFGPMGGTNTNLNMGIVTGTISATTGTIRVLQGDNVTMITSGTVNSKTWMHVAVVRVNDIFSLYINGTLSGSTFTSSLNKQFYNSLGNGAGNGIGCPWSGVLTTPFTGYIDDFRITKAARYTSNFAPPVSTFGDSTATDALFNQVVCSISAKTRTYQLNQNSKYVSDRSNNNIVVNTNGNAAKTNFGPFSGGWYIDSTYNSKFISGTVSKVSYASGVGIGFADGPYTIEFFISFASPKTTNVWFLSESYQYGVVVGINSSGKLVRAARHTWVGATEANVPTELNVWHHVAIVRSGVGTNQEKMYINGQLVAVGTNTDYLHDSSITINENPCNIKISNIRICKSVVYSTTFTPPTSALIALPSTVLLVGATNNFNDMSSYRRAPTTTGEPAIFSSTDLSEYPVQEPQISKGGNIKLTGNSYFYVNSTTGSSFNYGTGDFTIEFFIYPLGITTGASAQTFFNQQGGPVWNSNSTGLRLSHTALLYGNTGSLTLTCGLKSLTWQHVAIVRTAGILNVYLNGRINGSVAFAGALGNIDNKPAFGTGQCASGLGTAGAEYGNALYRNIRICRSAVYQSEFSVSNLPSTVSNISLDIKETLVDQSANTFTLSLFGQTLEQTNTLVPYFEKKQNGSIFFYESGKDYLTLTADGWQNFGTDDFTVEFWLYMDNATFSSTAAICWSSITSNTWGIGITSGGFRWYWNGAACAQASGTVRPQEWTHLAVSRRSGTTRMYIQGKMESTFSDALNYIGSCGRRTIGPQNGTAQFRISEFRVTKSSIYNSDLFQVPTTPFQKTDTTVLLLNNFTNNIAEISSKSVSNAYGNVTLAPIEKFKDIPALCFSGAKGGSMLGFSSTTYLHDDFTIECWIYPRTSDKHIILGHPNGWAYVQAFGFGVWDSSNPYAGGNAAFTKGLALVLSTTNGYGGNIMYSKQVPNNNEWSHIAVTRKNGEIRFFLNGILGTNYSDNSIATAQSQINITNYPAPLMFSNSIGTFDGMLEGGNSCLLKAGINAYISELRVTNGKAKYTASFDPNKF